jgi:hypothetical protein
MAHRPPRPIATLGELHREPHWFWAHCEGCRRSHALPLGAFRDQMGTRRFERRAPAKSHLHRMRSPRCVPAASELGGFAGRPTAVSCKEQGATKNCMVPTWTCRRQSRKSPQRSRPAARVVPNVAGARAMPRPPNAIARALLQRRIRPAFANRRPAHPGAGLLL